eukprot:TRINITY_DN8127_c0_g1_i1.p1 TRINITY_DN8127_c0_g1~~TRINITY_DN8127_c0_g1_i1.p1  ORF type:complete len:265 (-),score=61.29 TRINITY_DN8127_c0_g1_i1:144-938(-)
MWGKVLILFASVFALCYASEIVLPTNTPSSLVAATAMLNPHYLYYAQGSNEYTCDATSTWVLTKSRASLYSNTENTHLVGNYQLVMLTTPTWTHFDGSTLQGSSVDSQLSPDGSVNLNWQLFNVSHTGPQGTYTPITYVLRASTRGGLPSTGGCTTGMTTSVAWASWEVFYVPQFNCTTGMCCSNGLTLPRGHECRPSFGPCDVEEHCTGLNGVCPDNSVLPEGTPCTTSNDDESVCTGKNALCFNLKKQKEHHSSKSWNDDSH